MTERERPLDFIRAKVADDLRTAKYGGRVTTRFPPEPNGFLHIGHAKSICLNFGIAAEHGGTCNLRFDDTNPITEEARYTQAIEEDVRWLGFDWDDRLYYASDYFERLYQYAVRLIEKDRAYVDSSSEEEIREYRGTVTQPGTDSPYRTRTIEENLDLFGRMRAGEFPNGAHVLRAKIDMASPNMLMRDPLLYRIRHAHHYRTGDAWCIYPMYDFAHCLSDAIEGITHSLCTLEFKDNRELYDWVLREVAIPTPPEQTEFARLNLEHTVLSKRKLIRLVGEGFVSGWDDPRMPTLAGLRRRGVTPEAIRAFCEMIGVAKVDSRVDIGKLEYAVRDDLNRKVPRVMAVLRPLKVVLVNHPADEVQWLDAPYYPHDVPKEGSRKVPFGRELFIEQDDFNEDPPEGYFRLSPGREVRLRYAYFIKCVDVVKDPSTGEVVELRCEYDPDTRGGKAPDGRKVKGTIHWVSAAHALPAEVRLYDRLFTAADPDDTPEGQDFTVHLNPDSRATLTASRIEPSVADDPAGTRYQFERQGYFFSDPVDASGGRLVFNRTVTLRDTWAKVVAKQEGAAVAASAQVGTPTDARPRRRKTAPRIRVGTPEYDARMARYTGELGLSNKDAEAIAANRTLAVFFEEAVGTHGDPAAIAKWTVNEVTRATKDRSVEDLPFGGRELGALARLVDDGAVSRSAARAVLAELMQHGGDPAEIVRRHGLEQLADRTSLEPLVDRVLAAHPAEVDRYRAGKTELLGFFVGQIMRESGGRANPPLVKELLESKLG